MNPTKTLTICILFILFTSFSTGYDRGLHDGKLAGQHDCIKYGSQDVLRKIPTLYLSDTDYKNGYKSGFLDGYHSTRYLGLR